MSDCISREQAIKSAECIIESNSVMKTLCILRMLKELPSVSKNDDCISRQAVLDLIEHYNSDGLGTVFIDYEHGEKLDNAVRALPSVTPIELTGHCKDCKYFECDSVAKVDGIPLIVAHEICSRWGDGCKTKEDGYCFLFEPQERSEKECR